MLAVLNVLGSMLMLFSVTFALPMITSIVYVDGMLVDFVYAAVTCLGVGASVYGATLRHRRELRSRDGFLLVTNRRQPGRHAARAAGLPRPGGAPPCAGAGAPGLAPRG